MAQKTFTVAGIATDPKGKTKVRYANNLQKRIITLFSNKFTDIQFVELPHAMNKPEVCEHLLTLSEFSQHHGLIRSERSKINRKTKVTSDDILKAILSRKVETDEQQTI